MKSLRTFPFPSRVVVGETIFSNRHPHKKQWSANIYAAKNSPDKVVISRPAMSGHGPGVQIQIDFCISKSDYIANKKEIERSIWDLEIDMSDNIILR